MKEEGMTGKKDQDKISKIGSKSLKEMMIRVHLPPMILAIRKVTTLAKKKKKIKMAVEMLAEKSEIALRLMVNLEKLKKVAGLGTICLRNTRNMSQYLNSKRNI